jgi:RNA polymerase sigma-70 factor (ECF subfamily)
LTAGNFDNLYPRLFRSLTRLGWALGLGYEAEDVAQEVLLSGRRQLRQLRDPDKLSPWLRRMMVRAASRRLGRRRSLPLDGAVAYVPQDRSSEIDLGVAVARLPPRERLAVTLVYGLGYSQQEAADAMGITRGGVANSLFKARARLVRQLGEGSQVER